MKYVWYQKIGFKKNWKSLACFLYLLLKICEEFNKTYWFWIIELYYLINKKS